MNDRSHLRVAALAAGAILAAGFSAWRWAVAEGGMPLDPAMLLLFGAVGVAVRGASIRLYDSFDLDLDALLWVAALFILGPRWAAVVAASTTGLHLAWTRLYRGVGSSPAERWGGWLFTTASSAATLLFAAWVTEAGALVSELAAIAYAPTDGEGARALAERLALRLALLASVFLAARFVMLVLRLVVEGRSFRQSVGRALAPGLGVEVAMLPVAYLLVFSYHRSLLPSLSGANAAFLLILVAYAGVVVGVRFLARYSDQVRARLQEMERLNRFHSKISSSLQLHLLSEMVTDTLLETFVDVDGAAVVLQRENLVRVRGRTEAFERRIEHDVLERLKKHDDARSDYAVFLPLAPETRGGGLVGFFREPKLRRAFSKGDLRVYRLLVNIVDVAVQNARLYEIATIDGLTGLYVRRYFEQRLTEEFIRSGRYGENFTLVLVDLNYFKQINDVYGHIVGDRILQAVGQILRDSVRSMDVPARYGGDEFAILLPRASREDAELIRERIDEGIERCAVEVGGVRVGVSASIGMASYLTDRPADPTEMILKADDRLYEAKAHRRKPAAS